jgi:hypothetical protein
MSIHLKVGDRVRVTAANRTTGYQPGDKGPVLRVITLISTGSPCYTVVMDKDGATGMPVAFECTEIEPDV